jgi:hypothetical protein
MQAGTKSSRNHKDLDWRARYNLRLPRGHAERIMEAEQLNLLANKLVDLNDRVAQLRRYL